MASSSRHLPFLRVAAFLLVAEGLYSFLQETVFDLPSLPNWSAAVGYFLGGLTHLFCVYIALRLMHRLDAESPALLLGPRRKGWERELALGVCVGSALSLGHILILWAGGWYRITGHDPHFRLVASIIHYLIVAVWEEACFRGYVFRAIEPRCGTLAALLTSSLLFGGAHIVYHVQDYALLGAVMRVLMFFIAGLFLGGAYLVSRRLWLPIGIHWAVDIFETMFLPGAYFSGGTYFKAQVSDNEDGWVWVALNALAGVALLALAVCRGRWRAARRLPDPEEDGGTDV